ncbi:MAG TPA: GxxExxY protein [Verrucomicrobiae bacterium]|nr:GxxExxY protein [Verrucomicrobiae bacterium]
MDSALLYREESFQVVGACFEVYKEKGCGFLESVYQECLGIEFQIRNIAHTVQKLLPLSYKGRVLQSTYIPDFLCLDKIVLELKAVTELMDEHRAQVLNYLRASGYRLGILANFGHYPKLQVERIVAERGRYEKLAANFLQP